jgi:hypothetical protein
MKKLYLAYLFFLCQSATLAAQDCNALGAWLWHLEITGYQTHADLADTLSDLGIKRVYVKVADGSIDSIIWPELVDNTLLHAYKSNGMEVWAWSYNYPGNEAKQAEALYVAAREGYDGFVVDVEMQFDGEVVKANNLFARFKAEKNRAIADGLIDSSFQLYCTTWGNPIDHNFPISTIDPFVDGFMPQTYVENWGPSFTENLSFWLDSGTQEYKTIGATKDIHHIVSTEKGIITTEEVNEFIAVAGPETSVWVIPGSNTSLSLWDTWREIDWTHDFCLSTSTIELNDNSYTNVYPNPSDDHISIEIAPMYSSYEISILDFYGRLIAKSYDKYNIDISYLKSGFYTISIHLNNEYTHYVKFQKI